MTLRDPNSPYVSMEMLEALFDVSCADTLLNWPHGDPAPPVSAADNPDRHHAGRFLTWYGRFMKAEQVAEALEISVETLATWQRSGLGPRALLMGRREPHFYERASGVLSARQGEQVFIYRRADVDAWLRPIQGRSR